MSMNGRPGTVLATQPDMPWAVVQHDADPDSGLPAQKVRVRVSDLQQPNDPQQTWQVQ